MNSKHSLISLVINLLNSQNTHMSLLSGEAKRILDFLDYETKRMIEIIQAEEKPLISDEIGRDIGTPFSDNELASFGRIDEVVIRSGWVIDGLQCIYLDKNGMKHEGPVHGGLGGHSNKIKLASDEKIEGVVVGYGEFDNPKYGVEELTFCIRNDSGNKHKCGPFGRGASPEALENLRQYGKTVLSKKNVTFGSNYYLGEIKGRQTGFISSLHFIFYRDFSPILKLDLSQRLEETIRLLRGRTNPIPASTISRRILGLILTRENNGEAKQQIEN